MRMQLSNLNDGLKKRFHGYGVYQVTTEVDGSKCTYSLDLEEMVRGDTQCFQKMAEAFRDDYCDS